MILERVSPMNLEEISAEFPRVARRLGLIYLGRRNIEGTMLSNGLVVRGEHVVFECSYPPAVVSTLEHLPAMACLIPGRVAVFVQNGETHVSTYLATGLIRRARLAPPARAAQTKAARDYDRILTRLVSALCSRAFRAAARS